MLSYNSRIFVLYILFLVIIIPFFLKICANTFSGYYMVGKNQIQNEQLEKILRGLLGIVLMGMMVVVLIGWPPVLLDVPEYLSGTGKNVTGTITEFTDGTPTGDGNLTLISAKIQEEGTKKIVPIKKTYFPNVKIGDQVKVSYLRHCSMGVVQEVNGITVSFKQKVNKGFFIIVMIMLHLYFIVRMLCVLTEKVKSNKSYKVHIHKGRCIAWIFVAEMINCWESIILAGAMAGHCNMEVKVMWNILLVVFYIFIFCLFMEDYYILKVNRKHIFYCDRKLKYCGSVNEIKAVEKSGKQIQIILENEKRLPIYDIETGIQYEGKNRYEKDNKK